MVELYHSTYIYVYIHPTHKLTLAERNRLPQEIQSGKKKKLKKKNTQARGAL